MVHDALQPPVGLLFDTLLRLGYSSTQEAAQTARVDKSKQVLSTHRKHPPAPLETGFRLETRAAGEPLSQCKALAMSWGLLWSQE